MKHYAHGGTDDLTYFDANSWRVRVGTGGIFDLGEEDLWVSDLTGYNLDVHGSKVQ
jgi:hypothetical protein